MRGAKALEISERTTRALALRRAGARYVDIAKDLGVALSVAHKLVSRTLRDIPREEADELRALEMERLDRDHRRIEEAMDIVSAKLRTGFSQAAVLSLAALLREARRIQDRRARYVGLDAPTRTELTGRDGGAIQVLGVDLSALSDDQLEALRATNDIRSLGVGAGPVIVEAPADDEDDDEEAADGYDDDPADPGPEGGAGDGAPTT